MELWSAQNSRAERIFASRKPVHETHFDVGAKFLVARGQAVSRFKKWPPMASKFYGPCEVTVAIHPGYMLKSQYGRISRQVIHAHRLVRYHERPLHLKS